MANQRNARGRASPGRVLVVETPGEIGPETEDKSEQETAAEEVIAETAAANPRSPEAIIYRLDPDTGEEKWVAKVSSSLVSNEWLAKKYGGGKYRVQHRKPNATGKMVYAQQETYTIDPSIRPEPITAVAIDGTPIGGPSRLDAIMEAGVMSLIQQMQNQNTTQMELVRSIIAERSQGKSSVDWVAILGALSPIVAALIPAFTNKPDVMEKAKEIAELATRNQGAQGGLKDMLGAFRELMEVRDLIGGGGDDRTTGERLLEAALPKFVELADKFATQHTTAPVGAPPAALQPGPIQPRVTSGSPPARESAPSSTVQPGTPMWLGFVSRAMPRWIELAKRDKDPALYAALEVDNMPPMFMGPLRAFLERDDAIDLVLTAYPQLKEYESWSREFFAEISTLVIGEDEEENENGTEDEEDREDEEIGGDIDGHNEADATTQEPEWASRERAQSRTVSDGGDSDELGTSRPASRSRQRRPRANGGNAGAHGDD